MSESTLVFQIMQELGKHGAIYRCNSGSVKLPNGKRFQGMPAGFSDILFIRNDGVACFVGFLSFVNFFQRCLVDVVH